MKDLILVESPTKARTLDRFLKGKFDIVASMGHVRDLPKGELGVDTQNDFAPKYVIPKDKRKVVEGLKERVQNVKRIILATDPDREGEAIAYHLQELLKDETKNSTKFDRIVFHEITEGAIEEALVNPRLIDGNLVSAQTARRVLDRIVGYKLSPLLWEKIKRNLSAGRVQSVSLRLIVEREKEIEKFKTEKYFRVFVILSKQNNKYYEFELVEIKGNKVERIEKLNLYDGEYKFSKTMLDGKQAKDILSDLPSKNYEVIDVIQKDTKRSPYPPFITSTLQIEAARRLGYPSRRTMRIAQKLYEEGLITYHRTDSFNLSSQFLSRARAYVTKEFGEKYLQPRTYKTHSKVAQEAHEAIRPTSLDSISNINPPAGGQISKNLGKDYVKLYELIWKRAVATQMADAIFKSTKVQVKAPASPDGGRDYLFEKSGSILVFDGFLKLWFYEESDKLLPEFSVGEILRYQDGKMTEHTTAPPPRYSEASLISALEKHGIGRPSTYATIVSTIQDRNYVEKEENRFSPTPIGIAVNDFLVKHFEDIDDIPFTSEMEDELDDVANGEEEWVPMMKKFYSPFEKDLKKAEKEEKVEVKTEKTGENCPEDGGDIVIRWGRFGKFLSCNNFPNCKYKAPLIEKTEFTCPKDGGTVIVKKTRRGRSFYGCSNYPKCDFAVWNKTQLLKELKQN